MTSPTPTTTTQTPLTPTTQSVRGRFLWHELHTKNVTQATAFYSAVTGWTVTTVTPTPGMEPYTMLVNDSVPVAGVWQYPAEELAKNPTFAWVPYIGTEDTNATCAEAEKMGAKVKLPPTDIPTVGRIAELTDPQGIPFALLTPSTPVLAEEAPKNGEFSWHDLASTNADAAFDFYSALFAWKKTTAMDMGKDGIYQMWGRDRFTYGGMFNLGSAPGPSHWLGYIQVADINNALNAVRTHGGTVVMGPHEVPGGDLIAQCIDDQGARFALHGKKSG